MKLNRLAVFFLAIQLIIFLTVPSQLYAFDNKSNTINVSGDAEVHIRPDILIMSFGIKEFDSNVKKAYVATDSVIADIIKIAGEYGIPRDYIQTSQLEIIPERSYKKEVKGVGISRVIQIVAHDPIPSEMDKMLMEVILAGANTVLDFTYKTTELEKYRNEARNMAMQNAMNRANSLLEGTNSELGKPLQISESGSSCYPYYRRYRSWWNNNSHSSLDMYSSQIFSSHLSGSDNTSDDGEASIAMGMIVVRSEIDVIFEIR